MARITVIPLFKSTRISSGGASTSSSIDLRYAANNGMFALSVVAAAGTAGTSGTTVFTYTGCATETGTYISPSNAVAIGTFGTSCASDIRTFEPELTAFIKLIATQTGTGTTAEKDSVITAELLMQ